MKTSALFILGSIFALSATAAEVQVMTFENSVYALNNVVTEFKINKDMNRAWVETAVDNRTSPDDSIGEDTYRARVEGLTYDVAAGEITLDVEGARVVCANVRKSGFGPFRYDKVIMTPDCKFKAVKSNVVVDNGYETYNRQMVTISIITK